MEALDKRPIVLISYRDRLTHLNCLVPYLNRYFPHLRLAICQQDDDAVWNKGLLYNAGYKELAKEHGYIILHDIDWVPAVGKVDYSYCEVPTMIGTQASQFGYRLYYPTFFGGVVVLSKEHYELVNGFSNQFRGYGGEDDHFRNSFIQKGIQPATRDGRFECFEHTRPDIRGSYRQHPDYVHNLKLVHTQRDFSEGLSTAQYTISNRTDTEECIHLKVRTI